MSTNIIKTNGTVLTTLQDDSVDTKSSSIILVGRNVYGYGSYIESSMVRIMENFCNTSAPNNPLTGQEWFNQTTNKLTYYNNQWISILDNNDLQTINGSISNLQTEIDNINTHLTTLDGDIVTINGELSDLQNKLQTDFDGLNSELSVIDGRVTTLENNLKDYLPLDGGIMSGDIILNNNVGIKNVTTGGILYNNENNIDIISNNGTKLLTYNLSTTPTITSNIDVYGKTNIYMGADSQLVATQTWTTNNLVQGNYQIGTSDKRIKATKFSNNSVWDCYDNSGSDVWVEMADKNWVNSFVGSDTFVQSTIGYYIFKSGLILQWGSGTYNTNNFPITFPNKALQIFASNTNSQGAHDDNAFAYIINNSQYYIQTKSSGDNGISGYPTCWFAIGF